ncbi:hypothetical protein CPB83DRAFT_853693, partial [Crepidotus variabilis]
MGSARTGAQKAHISHLAARLAAQKHRLGDEAARPTTPRSTTRKTAANEKLQNDISCLKARAVDFQGQLEAITLPSTQLEVDLIERTNRVTQL